MLRCAVGSVCGAAAPGGHTCSHVPRVTRVPAQRRVTDLLFPTSWVDELPWLVAPAVQAAWAAANQVNLLASGRHAPERQGGQVLLTAAKYCNCGLLSAGQRDLLPARPPQLHVQRGGGVPAGHRAGARHQEGGAGGSGGRAEDTAGPGGGLGQELGLQRGHDLLQPGGDGAGPPPHAEAVPPRGLLLRGQLPHPRPRAQRGQVPQQQPCVGCRRLGVAGTCWWPSPGPAP